MPYIYVISAPQAHDLFFEVHVNTYIYLKTNPVSPLSAAYMNMYLGLTTWELDPGEDRFSPSPQ